MLNSNLQFTPVQATTEITNEVMAQIKKPDELNVHQNQLWQLMKAIDASYGFIKKEVRDKPLSRVYETSMLIARTVPHTRQHVWDVINDILNDVHLQLDRETYIRTRQRLFDVFSQTVDVTNELPSITITDHVPRQ